MADLSRSDVAIDTYTHLMPVDEADATTLLAALEDKP